MTKLAEDFVRAAYYPVKFSWQIRKLTGKKIWLRMTT